jgi:predicted PurR-regulated permease PerM
MQDKTQGLKIFYSLALVFAFLILAGFFLRHTFSVILTSLAIAYLLNPLLKYLERRGFDRITALALLYGISLLAALLASFLFIPYLLHQTEALVNSFPHYLKNLERSLEWWKEQIAPHYAGREGAWLIEQLEHSLESLARELSGSGYRQIKGLLFGIFDLVLAPILVFMILYYKEYFKKTVTRMIPLTERHHLKILGRKINRSLERFILGMLLDCLMVGILTVAALYMLDIEFPVLNGLFAGFTSIVPFIGVLVAIIPAAFIGYAKTGDFSILLKIGAAYFFIYVIIEGNLIKPLIMKRTLRLNPLAVIFSIMAMGELLGFWGIVLAIPLAAVIKICAGEVYDLLHDEKSVKGSRNNESIKLPEAAGKIKD